MAGSGVAPCPRAAPWFGDGVADTVVDEGGPDSCEVEGVIGARGVGRGGCLRLWNIVLGAIVNRLCQAVAVQVWQAVKQSQVYEKTRNAVAAIMNRKKERNDRCQEWRAGRGDESVSPREEAWPGCDVRLL